MIMTTPPSRGIWSRKRKREVEEASPSTEAVSEKNSKETAPMVLARWKTMAYKGISRKRRSWAGQQRAEVNKLELKNQLGRTWENLLAA